MELLLLAACFYRKVRPVPVAGTTLHKPSPYPAVAGEIEAGSSGAESHHCKTNMARGWQEGWSVLCIILPAVQLCVIKCALP